MEFLGVGPMELIFIFLIALIVLGPKDIVKAGRTMGRFLNRIVTSPTWRAIKQTSREMRTLPTRLMHEAGIEEEVKEFKDINLDVQELKKMSSSFSPKEEEKEEKESFPENSIKTNYPNNQPEIQKSIKVSPTSSSLDSESSQPHPAKDQKVSDTASVEPKES